MHYMVGCLRDGRMRSGKPQRNSSKSRISAGLCFSCRCPINQSSRLNELTIFLLPKYQHITSRSCHGDYIYFYLSLVQRQHRHQHSGQSSSTRHKHDSLNEVSMSTSNKTIQFAVLFCIFCRPIFVSLQRASNSSLERVFFFFQQAIQSRERIVCQ